MLVFEVNAVTTSYIQIFVEHPFIESIVTIELDLSEITKLSCKIFYGDNRISENDNKMEKYAVKILQQGFSIPIMLRLLIQLWEKEFKNSNNSNYSSLTSNFGDEQRFSLNSSLLNVDKIRDCDDEMSGDKGDTDGENKKENNKRGDKESKKDIRKNTGKDHDNHDDDSFGNGGTNGNGSSANNGSSYGSSRGGQYNNNSGGSKDTQNTKNDNSGNKKSGSSADKLTSSDPSGIFDSSSSGFDICGVNKNEIFFKTDQSTLLDPEVPNKAPTQPKITFKRVHDNDFDIFGAQKNKKSAYEGNAEYDFEDIDEELEEEEDEEMDDTMNEVYINENSSSSSSDGSSSSSSNSSSSASETSNKKSKKMLNSKKSLWFSSKNNTSSPTTKATKPLDVFEFTPSPPAPSTGTAPLPLTSPSDSKNSSSMTTHHILSNLESNNRIHDIEIIPLKGQTNPQGDPISNPNSITITPINTNYFSKDKKGVSSGSLEEKLKKKKRKRDEDAGKDPHKKQSSSGSSSSSLKKDIKKKEYSSKNLTTPGSSSDHKMKEMVKKSPSIEGKSESSPKSKSNNKLKLSGIEDMTLDPNDPNMYGFSNDEKMMIMSMNAQQGNQGSSLANMKNRKVSSLSDVINKLKSAQTNEFGLIEGLVDDSSQGGGSKSSSSSGKDSGEFAYLDCISKEFSQQFEIFQVRSKTQNIK